MKKYGKISLIFEFPTSKLVYVVIFMKIREKKFNPSFKKILTIQAEMKIKMKKMEK